MKKKKIIRTSTVPVSLDVFCRGLLRELSSVYEVVALSSPGAELDAVASREGVRTIAVPMRRQIAPWHDAAALSRMVRVFGRERPQMVHSMTPKAGLLSMLAARMARVPVRVHTFTGLVFPTERGWKRRLLMLTDRITAACATHIVPEGEGIRNDLLRYGVTRKPLQVLGHGNVRGIDLRHYDRTPEVLRAAAAIRTSLGIPKGAFTFIFVGRLVPDKGIGELVEAFCRLLEERHNVHLLLVGGEERWLSPLQDSTRRMIAATGNIHSAGWQEDVRPWYAAADALVFPSHREGFPNVVIEAGAMGLPSIVTDINGAREIVREGENGTIVPPMDTGMLYGRMRRFATDGTFTEALAGNARRSVRRFEQGYVWDCLKAYYREILDGCV